MSLSGKNKGNRKVWLGVAVLIGIDLLSKYLVFTRGVDSQFITPALNPGGAWSLDIGIPVIMGVTILACTGLIYLYYKKLIHTAAFILLLAGGIANGYDRVVYGAVRDWIHLGWFPIFNIADICITIGVIMIAFQYKKQSRTLRH